MRRKSENIGKNKEKVSGFMTQKKQSINIKKRFDLLPLIFTLFLLILWELLVLTTALPAYILPSPTQVITALFEQFNLIIGHAMITLVECLIGFLYAILLGFILGIAMGYFEKVRRVLLPFFVVSQAIPLVVLAPLFAIWFGFGLLPKVLIVLLVCFFPIAVSFTQGLCTADTGMDDLLYVMGAKRFKAFSIAKLPQALPSFFAGVKIAATYSMMGAVISEWIGAKSGLGIYMTITMKSYKTPALFADVFVIVCLSLLLYHLVGLFERDWMKRMGFEEPQ